MAMKIQCKTRETGNDLKMLGSAKSYVADCISVAINVCGLNLVQTMHTVKDMLK